MKADLTKHYISFHTKQGETVVNNSSNGSIRKTQKYKSTSDSYIVPIVDVASPINATPTKNMPIAQPITATPNFATPIKAIANGMSTNGTPFYVYPINAQHINAMPTIATPTNATPTNAMPTKDVPIAQPIKATPNFAAPIKAMPANDMPTNPKPFYVSPINGQHINATPTNITPINTTPINATPMNATPGGTPPVSLCFKPSLTQKPAEVKPKFKCSKCDTFFENIANLTKHFAIAHQIKEVQEYKPHLATVHEGNETEIIDKEHKFKCVLCSAIIMCPSKEGKPLNFGFTSELYQHLFNAHRYDFKTNNVDEYFVSVHEEKGDKQKNSDEKVSEIDSSVPMFKCSQCAYFSKHYADLEQHFVSVHEVNDLSNLSVHERNEPSNSQNVPPKDDNELAKDFTEDEKMAIVDECTVEMYSPTLLAEKYNINVTFIRGWVKAAGKTLPQKYKLNGTKVGTKPLTSSDLGQNLVSIHERNELWSNSINVKQYFQPKETFGLVCQKNDSENQADEFDPLAMALQAYEQIQKTDEQFHEIDEQIHDTDEQIHDTDEQFQEANEQFQEANEQFQQADEQFNDTDKQLQVADEQIVQTGDQFLKIDEQFMQKDEQIQQTDEQIQQTDEQIQPKDEQIQPKDEQIQPKDEQIQELDEQMEIKEEDIDLSEQAETRVLLFDFEKVE